MSATVALPAGTVTLLFSDIEGSTRLLQRLGAEYGALLEESRRLFRRCVERAGGAEVDTQGDAFFVAFPDAGRAVEAAVEIQRAHLQHAWPQSVAVRVRMGIHSGRPELTGSGYVGLDVHEAARICAAAHGGQILVSDATREHLAAAPHSWHLRTLGRFRLKDIAEPRQLHQVAAAELPAEFPPLRTVDARPHNLPAETTEFVGRRRERAELLDTLEHARLVTLVGPGGSGKTRLALQAARELLGSFADGVYLVRLEALSRADLVARAIGRVLGVPEGDEATLLDRIAAVLQARKLLLVLDNFEHVLAAAPVVARLLAAAPGVHVLVTSQAPLRLSGEHLMPLPPLALPAVGGGGDSAELLEVDSIDLFVRRARAADPSFHPSPREVRDIAEIVVRLEGMPLAIELAAARIRLLPPRSLLARLDDQLKLLRRGPVDAPERHRTLAGLVAWSYGLLTSSEQALLRRLSVFRGGFRVEAAEVVADDEPVDDVLSALESLLEKSLLRRMADALDIRLTMNDAVREFAGRQLRSAGEASLVARRHAEHFLTAVLAAEPELTHSGQREIQARLAADEHNLRDALQVLRSEGPLEQALGFCAAVWRFWHANGQLEEGRRILAELLARPGAPPRARARALTALAGLSYWQADYPAALAAYHEALELFEQHGAALDVAETLFAISTTSTWSGAAAEGERWADKALAAFRGLGHREGIGRVLMAHGFARWMRGDLAGARPLWDESLRIARECGDHVEAATKEVALSAIRFGLGERKEAICQVVHALDELVRRRNVSHVVMALDFVAAILVHEAPETGCRLAGAADALRESLGGGMRPEKSGLEPARLVAERALGPGRAAEAFRAGTELDLEAALRLAWAAV